MSRANKPLTLFLAGTLDTTSCIALFEGPLLLILVLHGRIPAAEFAVTSPLCGCLLYLQYWLQSTTQQATSSTCHSTQQRNSDSCFGHIDHFAVPRHPAT